ncbi:MAG TPA: hypothetical protein PLG34_03380 [Spirochaetota bacterium]|jgi:hypothetical protein|nr:MAG: hypothetical protein BWX91_00035 [Spirochaetes bacterium ADurb.Bin133]HNZ25779.1 hypothetical protein [Spirochaetota bacterium]HPY87004.1 hypothetical protein [Spirochaetota bacterium]
MLKKIRIFFLFIILISCQSKSIIDEYSVKEAKNYGKYVDTYDKYIYNNETIAFSVEFDYNWEIKVNYDKFNDFEKKYADYITTDYGEVLFIGYNDLKKIGVRCVSEDLNISNEQYLKDFKNSLSRETVSYKIEVVSEKKVDFKNYTALNFVYTAKISRNNLFYFDSILFRNGKYNIKLDFWTNKDYLETNKEEILKIYDSLEFQSVYADVSADQSDDATSDKTEEIPDE